MTDRNRDVALQQTEARLREVIDTIPAAVWSAGPDGQVDFVNRRWLEFLGMSRREFAKRGWKAVVHPDDLERSEASWRRVLTAGKPFEIEHRVKGASGEYRWLLAKGVPFRDESGRIVRWYGSAIDIEDRKRSGDALRQSEDRLRHVIDAVPAIVWSALPDGSIDFLNERWMAYTGQPLEEALGWGWTATMHPEDLARTTEYWRALLVSGEPAEIEHRIRGIDSAFRWFLTRYVPVRDASGAITRWFGTCTDIEERKLAEETLRRNQTFFISEAQRIGRLLGSVSPEDNGVPSMAAGSAAWPAGGAGDERFAAERRAVESLTANERSIIRLIAEGKSNAEIAASLHLSPRTVETYRGRLMQKLQIADIASLIKLAIRQGLSSVE